MSADKLSIVELLQRVLAEASPHAHTLICCRGGRWKDGRPNVPTEGCPGCDALKFVEEHREGVPLTQNQCKRQAAYDAGAVRGSVALVDCDCPLCRPQSEREKRLVEAAQHVRYSWHAHNPEHCTECQKLVVALAAYEGSEK